MTMTDTDRDVTVPAEPFREWLKEQVRRGWTTCLSENQVRYIERVLDPGRDLPRLSVYYIDEILVALDLPWILSILYPE
jgi:hypothetical protein